VRTDLGNLIIAFSLLTAYMMFSQLLPIWYENLRHEVRFVMPRAYGPNWTTVSAGLLATVYLGPLAMLLWRRVKTGRGLAVVAGIVLAGMWVERWWLVTPTMMELLHGQSVSAQAGPQWPTLGVLPELAASLALVAAMALGMRAARRFVATPARQDEPTQEAGHV
jgi:hypothetical protein